MDKHNLTDFLPTSRKELELRGWDSVDVILFSGDAYVDHPSFGAAVIGRTLEAQGLRVAIVPQPNWRDDLRDFKKLGRPRLFFAISAGCMDSMVNHYTANKRLRSDDAYTPGGKAGMRPDYCTITYAHLIKRLYPDVPLVIGGIEASMRRLTHYDYWADQLKQSILPDSGADLLVYGMGEKPVCEIARRLQAGAPVGSLTDVPQTAWLSTTPPAPAPGDIVLNPHETCLKDKTKYAENFRHIEEESNRIEARRLIQQTGGRYVVVNPPCPPMTTAELDATFALPYTRLPHPRYKDKPIPAYEMIRFSVNLHRGCFGGCAFCTISAHQGKHIVSRSKESILDEVRKITALPGFKGYLSDLGGPSANMYRMGGRNPELCRRCAKPSCIYPAVCPNLDCDHRPLLDIYHAVCKLPGIRKAFIGSGVRYDLLLHRNADEALNRAARQYTQELIEQHTSGRLKVAPEHTSSRVLALMRKPSFALFREFKREFDRITAQAGLNYQLIPYFISSHPGCTQEDMAELAAITKGMDFRLEQVQDFTPTPMTLATDMYYSGINPYTGEKIYTAKTKDEKLEQRKFFFWYKPEHRAALLRDLQRMNRPDLRDKLFGAGFAPKGRQQPEQSRPRNTAPKRRKK